MVGARQALVDGNFNGDVDNELKDKEAAKQFLIVCQATHCTNQITFDMRDYKKSPQEVYDQYVRTGTPDQIEFESDATLGNDWAQAAQNPQTLPTQGLSHPRVVKTSVWATINSADRLKTNAIARIL
jgi:hypothetical protein